MFVGLTSGRTAFPAEIICQADADGRMEKSKQPLANRVAENFFDELISMIIGAEAITVPDQKFFIIKVKCFWLMIHGYIQFFFKITPHPHIMVAYEKRDRNSTIRYFGELT